MGIDVKIEQLHSVQDHLDELAEMLIQVVEDGASIGFLPPLKLTEAIGYWESVISPDVILLVATMGDQLAGSVQVHLCMKPNGSHRAEIAKLMTHPLYRRNGIGRLLMQRAEEISKQSGRTLLVLDTRDKDPSNHLYSSLGFMQAGQIPQYARSASGDLDATNLYYKNLTSN